jgi:hypothetical protein
MRTILHNDSLHDPQLKQSVRAIAETVVTPPECCGDLQLNESQKKAILAAFSQRVTLIQGPPGTGIRFNSNSLGLIWIFGQEKQEHQQS